MKNLFTVFACCAAMAFAWVLLGPEEVAAQVSPAGGCNPGQNCTSANVISGAGTFSGAVTADSYTSTNAVLAYTMPSNAYLCSNGAGCSANYRYTGAHEFTGGTTLQAPDFTATSTTEPNLTCAAATGEECVTAKRGARVYFDYDNTTTAHYLSYQVSNDSIAGNGVGIDIGNNTLRVGALVRDVDNSPITMGALGADTAGTNSLFFFNNSASPRTNDDYNVAMFSNTNSTTGAVVRIRAESGSYQPLGYATASLQACNANSLTTATGTKGVLQFDSTTGRYVTCDGVTNKTVTVMTYNAGAPAAGDCDSDDERGQFVTDTTNFRLYVCMGATRGWDYSALTD